MAALDLIVLTFARAMSFAALMFFVSRRVIPFSVRAACAVSLVVLCVGGQPRIDFASLVFTDRLDIGVSHTDLLREVAIGLLLALIAAAPVLVMHCVAVWLQAVFVPSLEASPKVTAEGEHATERGLVLALVLWFFVVVLDLPGLREVFALFAASVEFNVPGGGAEAITSAGYRDAVLYVGRNVMLLSFAIATPLVIASVGIDAVIMFAGRYLRELSAPQVVYAIKIPLFISLLLVSMYPLSRELQEVTGQFYGWGQRQVALR